MFFHGRLVVVAVGAKAAVLCQTQVSILTSAHVQIAHMKNWDKICSEIETPPDSDADDELNVLKVQKNAQKISDVLHHMLPNLDDALAKSLPKGVNSMAAFSQPFQKLAKELGGERGMQTEPYAATKGGQGGETSSSETGREVENGEEKDGGDGETGVV